MDKRSKHPKASPGQPDDLELWSRVTESVTPLRRRLGETARTPKKRDPQEDKGSANPAPKPSAKAPTRTVVPQAPKRITPPSPPPMTGLDRRTSQKLARGNVDIEARIDLHGMGKESARGALKSFLKASRLAGRRTVLVITGKGSSPYSSHTLHGYQQIDTPERQGVIRRAFPQWLEEAEFRAHVAGYQPAHPRHGGGGAFYVRLRKLK